MTDQTKQNILDYVTNNIVQTEQQARTTFKWADTNSAGFEVGDTNILPPNYNQIKYTNIVASNESADISIMYGYYVYNNQYYGIITVLGENFVPLKSFFKYDSNTYLRPILSLEQAEDNTFYGIDSDMAQTPQDRFIMLNNFTIPNGLGEYTVDLRKTYNVPTTPNNCYVDKVYKMYKNTSSAHYVIFGSSGSTMKVVDLKVNVGEPNEWDVKSFNSSSGTYKQNGTPIAMYDENDDTSWTFLALESFSGGISSMIAISKNFGSQTTTKTTLESGLSVNNIFDYKFLTTNVVYYSYGNNLLSFLQKYDFSDNTVTTIASPANSGAGLYMYACNSAIYYYFNSTNQVTFVRLVNDDINSSVYQTYNQNIEWFLVKANYNMVSILGLTKDANGIPTTKFYMYDNYNPLNYNDLSYTDYNSVVPKQVEIYGSNGMLFARNLSDNTVIDNTTTSTLIIPNNYLNTATTSLQQLLSETNTNIVQDTESITKNVYETVYLNFINTINVIDNNYYNNQFVDDTGTYINSNINVGTASNCSNSYIGKLVVNYEDGTSLTTDLLWTKQANNIAKTEFALEVNTGISTIEYKSNDLTTTYLSEVPQNINVGRTYKFTQYLKIE